MSSDRPPDAPVPIHDELERRCKPKREPMVDEFLGFLAEWRRCLEGVHRSELSRSAAAASSEQRAALQAQSKEWRRLGAALCWLVEEHRWLDWKTLSRPVGGVPDLDQGLCEIRMLEQQLYYLATVRAKDAAGYAAYVRAAEAKGRHGAAGVLAMRRNAEAALASSTSRDAGDASGSAPPDLAGIVARAADVESAAAELARAVAVAFPGLVDAVAQTRAPPDALAAHFDAPGSF